MRKPFVTPCWLMSLPATLIVYGLDRVSHLGALGLIMRPRRVTLPWLLLALTVIDAILYWSIRKTNSYRRDSLMHIILFSFAIITPDLREWLFEGYDDGFTFGLSISRFIGIVNMGQLIASQSKESKV